VGVVALDDAYGVMLFSLLLVLAEIVSGGEGSFAVVLDGLWEVAGACLLGGVLGGPMGWLSGRVRPGELTLLEALGFVLLCGGLATSFGVSHILACIALGATAARFSPPDMRPLHAIENVSQPFLVLFFLLAGLEFDPSAFGASVLVAVVYVVARTAGKFGGGYLGARIARAPDVVRRTIGWCLLPQAGIALGLGLVAAERLPEVGDELVSILVGTTFFFEVVGPLVTRAALASAGETAASRAASP